MIRFFQAFLFSLFLSPIAMAETVTNGKVKYTDFSDSSFCKDLSEGGDSWEVVCKGVPGYKIRMMGVDGHDYMVSSGQHTASMSLTLYNGKDVEIWNNASKYSLKGGVSHLTNKKIEWRYIKDGKDKIYYALIFRVYTGKKSQLFVARLEGPKSCLIGTTKSNKKARKIADDLSRRCLR